jgi:CDP-glucose 4,6-dehydratase
MWLAASLYNDFENLRNKAYNFGPLGSVNQSVAELLKAMSENWGGRKWTAEIPVNNDKPEATLLKLNCDRVQQELGWHAALEFDKTIEMTTAWYQAFYENEEIKGLTSLQINTYTDEARKQNLAWTK